METNIIFTLVNAVILLVSAYIAWNRNKAQNVVDDSTASTNYRRLVVEMQAELRTAKKETEEIKEMLSKSHLNVAMSIQIGEAPTIVSYEWSTVLDKKG